MLLAYLLLSGSSLLIIYDDVREQTIRVLGLAAFVLAGLLQQIGQPDPEGLWATGVIAFLFLGCQGLFYLFRKEPAMGWGDLLIGPACGLWLRLHELPSFLVTTGLVALSIGVVWRYQWKMRAYPLTPALLSGLGMVFLIRCFSIKNGL